MLHMSDQSWNNSLGSAAEYFLLNKLRHCLLYYRHDKVVPSNKATQHQSKKPKNHTSQLISSNICSLPVPSVLPTNQKHTKKHAKIPVLYTNP